MTSKTDVIDASPTKAFFVEMLTRDIELEDAILDLLDNCIDGIHRIKHEELDQHEISYEGFYAKISTTETSFEIQDNCGGIPLTTAQNYAFRMGRPQGQLIDENFYTIGTYGIGMKRAIFKMGQESQVISVHKDDAFQVVFSQSWLAQDNEWDLPLEDIEKEDKDEGTYIKITNLYPAISQQFSSPNGVLLNSLSRRISQHYSFIIQKGFDVYLNGSKISPQNNYLLLDQDYGNNEKNNEISPFLYQGTRNDVEIILAIGFYRKTISEEELEDEVSGTRRRSEEAGLTIICNDRVVVYCDKTRLTGWGEATVPSYHPQFIAITGIVHFRSKNARALPLTTTKRGIDASSDVYLYTKDFMREGLKLFTSYTNRWKKDLLNESRRIEQAKPQSIKEIFSKVSLSEGKWTKVNNRASEKKYIPNLPKPIVVNSNSQTIKFIKLTEEIKTVSDFLFEDDSISASKVGEACFQYVLDITQE